METSPSAHSDRVSRLSASFDEANGRLIARLRVAADGLAERVPAEGWSAAQIGWHVAAVTTRFAGMISGDITAAQPLPPDFKERAWAEVTGAIPERAESPAAVAPPPGVARDAAVTALEESGAAMARALATLTEERGARMGITHRAVGAITVFQIGEWAVSHVMRHNRQAKRVLGEG
ncbi:MAG: DinB family protein [Acidobacteriota bacterium]